VPLDVGSDHRGAAQRHSAAQRRRNLGFINWWIFYNPEYLNGGRWCTPPMTRIQRAAQTCERLFGFGQILYGDVELDKGSAEWAKRREEDAQLWHAQGHPLTVELACCA
jgi:hypothetical protein